MDMRRDMPKNNNKRTILISTLLCCGAMLLLLLTLIGSVSASDQMPFRIVSVTIRDEAGNPISQATRGQFIFVDIVIEKEAVPYYYDYYYYYDYGAQPFLVVARLTYGTPPSLMGLSGYRGSLAAGEQAEPTPGLQIPPTGPSGNYVITVLTYSNWPAAGGVTAAEPVLIVIPVT
jgi:hypothetical protein